MAIRRVYVLEPDQSNADSVVFAFALSKHERVAMKRAWFFRDAVTPLSSADHWGAAVTYANEYWVIPDAADNDTTWGRHGPFPNAVQAIRYAHILNEIERRFDAEAQSAQ